MLTRASLATQGTGPEVPAVPLTSFAATCACSTPVSVSTEKLELPWMRLRAFQVLCPWRTSTMRLEWRRRGSGSGGESRRSSSAENSSDPVQFHPTTPSSASAASAATAAAEAVRAAALPGRGGEGQVAATTAFCGRGGLQVW